MIRIRSLAVAAAISLALAACGGTGAKSGTGQQTANPNTVNAATVSDGGKIVMVLEKKVKYFNTLDADGNVLETAEIMNAIAPRTFMPNPDYSLSMNSDLLVDAELVAGAADQTVVYHVQPKAVWSDGTPIDAKDFLYNWLVQNGADSNLAPATTSGYQDVASVVGSDNGKTVTVTWKHGKTFPDWKTMFITLFPEHLAEQHGFSVDTVTGADGKVHAKDEAGLEQSWKSWTETPKWSGGPFVISDHAADGTSTTIVRNPRWYGATAKLEQVTFRTITDATQEPSAIGNGEVDVIIPQPEQNLLHQLDQYAGKVSHQVTAGLSFEHFDFNLHNTFFGGPDAADQNDPAKLALRKALFTAVDRRHMVASTVGLFDAAAAPLNNRMLVPGEKGFQDNVSRYGLGSGDLAAAKKLLTDAGYTGVGTALTTKDGTAVGPFRLRYTVGNKIRQDECDQFAAAAKQLGVTVNVESTDDLGATLDNADAQHAFDIVVFGWVLTVFPDSANAPLYVTNPPGATKATGGNYSWIANPDVDAALNDARSNLDPTVATADLNKADDLLSQLAVTLPLYQKDAMIAYNSKLGNIRENATNGGDTYNIGLWGFKAAAQ